MPFMFEILQVDQKAVDVSEQTCVLTESFPRGYCFLVEQLNRAALSIVTNLAEGNGRATKPDRKNFFITARGSVQEFVPLLGIAHRRGFISTTDHRATKETLEEISRMISGLISGLVNRQT